MDNQDDTFSTGFALALDKVHGWGESFYLILPNLAVALIVLVVAATLGYSLRRGIAVYFDRKDRADLGTILSGSAFWILFFFGVLVALTIVMPSLRPVDLVSSLGVGSIAVGFAFKDILQNWLAGLLILLRLPFRRGDQISMPGAEGTVIRIEPRATIIRTYDGRDVVVPNTMIYTSMVTINTSRPIRRIELDLTVGYAYNVDLIRLVINDAFASIEEVLKDPPPQILCWDLGATSLVIRLRWWIRSERAQEIAARARVVQAIKEAFEANDIDPTDPQLVYFRKADKTETPKPQESPVLQGRGALREAEAPDKVPVMQTDPEAEAPKLDSRDETLLPDD